MNSESIQWSCWYWYVYIKLTVLTFSRKLRSTVYGLISFVCCGLLVVYGLCLTVVFHTMSYISFHTFHTMSPTSTVAGTCGQLVEACWTSRESSCRHMEDVHSATPALPLGTLFLIIWRTVLFLCRSSETSWNIVFSHRTSTPSTFEVITETHNINYLLAYLLTCVQRWRGKWLRWSCGKKPRKTNSVRCCTEQDSCEVLRLFLAFSKSVGPVQKLYPAVRSAIHTRPLLSAVLTPTLTLTLLNWKLAHLLFVLWGTFTPIMIFLRLFVFELGAVA